jgi:uncharacterized membrane protein YfcA
MPALLIVAAIGLAAGVLAGLFGIGGGIVIVPALILLAGFSVTNAAGTSLAALLLPVGALGAWQYWQAGMIDLRAAIMLAIGILLGAYVGARFGIALPASTVQRAFGVLLVVVGLRFALLP